MLAIRLQRLGRKGYPVYRVAVQEAQRHPSSGRVVAYVGSYNPHTKATNLDVEKIEKYLSTGAQPSPRVVKLLVQEKVKLPSWVQKAGKKEKSTRNPEKLRKNQPEQPAEPEAPAEVEEVSVEAETPAEEQATEEPAVEVEEKAEEAEETPEAETAKAEAEESTPEKE
ncbi:30S ribosomal protein S16 [Candidatus Saccharibacteria bacterium]|nr:30S ribosomal protein S16 [Candidatus Saccharibacteria bacterium]